MSISFLKGFSSTSFCLDLTGLNFDWVAVVYVGAFSFVVEDLPDLSPAAAFGYAVSPAFLVDVDVYFLGGASFFLSSFFSPSL
jgi:hypothetical protein